MVREPDGVLRQATWEERDRMCQVFFPVHGRKMWLPKVLTDEGLPPVLDRMLHADVLDLVSVQCHPQSVDYHRVSMCYTDFIYVSVHETLTLSHIHTHDHSCTHIHTITHAHTYTRSLMHTHTHSLMHAHTHSCTHIHTITHAHTYTRSLMHTHTHSCTHIHTHAHTYNHTITITRTHTNIESFVYLTNPLF